MNITSYSEYKQELSKVQKELPLRKKLIKINSEAELFCRKLIPIFKAEFILFIVLTLVFYTNFLPDIPREIKDNGWYSAYRIPLVIIFAPFFSNMVSSIIMFFIKLIYLRKFTKGKEYRLFPLCKSSFVIIWLNLYTFRDFGRRYSEFSVFGAVDSKQQEQYTVNEGYHLAKGYYPENLTFCIYSKKNNFIFLEFNKFINDKYRYHIYEIQNQLKESKESKESKERRVYWNYCRSFRQEN